MTGAAIAAAVASVGSAGYSIVQAEQQKGKIKAQKEDQVKRIASQKADQTMAAAKGTATAKKVAQEAKIKKAVETAKISERKQRKGGKSLLTGTEAGIETQATIK